MHMRLFHRSHKPVCSSTLARYLRTLVCIGFQTAFTSSNVGVITADILKAADWSSDIQSSESEWFSDDQQHGEVCCTIMVEVH